MDRRLRDLERAAADGDPDARARLLAERLRAGAISAAHLRLAALLGDPVAARLRAGDAPFGPGRREEGALDVPGLVVALGPEVLARLALAVATTGLAEWRGRYPGDVRVPAVLTAAREAAAGRPLPPDELARAAREEAQASSREKMIEAMARDRELRLTGRSQVRGLRAEERGRGDVAGAALLGLGLLGTGCLVWKALA